MLPIHKGKPHGGIEERNVWGDVVAEYLLVPVASSSLTANRENFSPDVKFEIRIMNN